MYLSDWIAGIDKEYAQYGQNITVNRITGDVITLCRSGGQTAIAQKLREIGITNEDHIKIIANRLIVTF